MPTTSTPKSTKAPQRDENETTSLTASAGAVAPDEQADTSDQFAAAKLNAAMPVINGVPEVQPSALFTQPVLSEHGTRVDGNAVRVPDSGPSEQLSPVHESPPVTLRGPCEPPLVRGKPMPRLNRAQYAVVEALVGAGEVGLSKDQLDERTNRTDARKILKRLHDSNPQWASVIKLPGKRLLGYRIA